MDGRRRLDDQRSGAEHPVDERHPAAVEDACDRARRRGFPRGRGGGAGLPCGRGGFRLGPAFTGAALVYLGTASRTGAPPTRAEIAAELGFKSANAAEEHLQALARKVADDMASAAWRRKAARAVAGSVSSGMTVGLTIAV